MRRTSILGIIGLGLALAAPAGAEQGSLANRCPIYIEQLEEAQESLSNSDREGAVRALRLAQEALKECIRLEAEIQGLPIMLTGWRETAERA